jgi:protein ImuA
LQALRSHLHAPQAGAAYGVLHFGDASVAACLPAGGLALGNLHEIGARGPEAETGAVAAGFAACLLAGLPDRRPVFWIASCCDLHMPGLLAYGFDPGRLILVHTGSDAETLAAMETVLRAGTGAAVLGEVGKLGHLPARRLQLACRKRGSTGFVLRRWPHGRRETVEEATAAVTRWEVAPAPSEAAFREPGPARWCVALRHARGGYEGAWIMEATVDDATHPLRVVAGLADATPAPDRRRFAG